MKIKKTGKYITIAASAAAVLFTACGGGGSGTLVDNVTYTGTVDLSPIHKMLVCKSDTDTKDINSSYNEEDLPSTCDYTDENGTYSLSLPIGSELKILPIDGLTTIIATENDKIHPSEAPFFTELGFYATTSVSSNARIVYSDIVKDKISSLTPTQLYSLYRVNDENNITNDFFDTNETNVSLIGAYKEARDAQDVAIKKLFSSFIIEADKNVTDSITLDKNLEGYIFDAWLSASKDNNITIYDENVLKGIATSVISSFNADTTDSKDIVDNDKILQLEKYTYAVGAAVSEPLVNLVDTNVSMIETKSKYVYAQTLSSFSSYVQVLGERIENNTSISNTYYETSKTIANYYVSGYLIDAEGN